MKTYKLEQRKRIWKTIASANHLDELFKIWKETELANGKRLVRSDGKLIRQELPNDYR